MTDKLDTMVGGIAPRLSLRFITDRWDVSLNAEPVFIFGGTQGWMFEGTVGIGYRF
jgi:hypothetical protein